MRTLVFALLWGCSPASDILDPTLDTGPEGSGEQDGPTPAIEDTAAPEADDTAEPTDTGEALDSADPEPVTVDQACYPGPDRDWTVCLPVGILEPLPAAYQYPAPMGGSAQYLAPTAFLDLEAHSEDEVLAPNFVLGEFAQSWKGRYAVVQPHAVKRVQDLRDELGPLIVNSGYRSPEYNAGVGGATWSRHQYGDAFDLDPVSVDLVTLQEACGRHGAGYVGVYETHIHCDWRDDRLSEPFFGEAYRAAHLSGLPELRATIARHGNVFSAPAEGWDEGEPLREWRATSRDGEILLRARGRTFVPPADTARVDVTVGRALTRTLSLE